MLGAALCAPWPMMIHLDAITARQPSLLAIYGDASIASEPYRWCLWVVYLLLTLPAGFAIIGSTMVRSLRWLLLFVFLAAWYRAASYWWGLNLHTGESSIVVACVATFVPPVALVAFTVVVHRGLLRKQIRPGHCRKCGYCLLGLTRARCPECGTAFDPSRLQKQESRTARDTETS